MLTFPTTHLYPTWKLHASTCKLDEIRNFYGTQVWHITLFTKPEIHFQKWLGVTDFVQ